MIYFTHDNLKNTVFPRTFSLHIYTMPLWGSIVSLLAFINETNTFRIRAGITRFFLFVNHNSHIYASYLYVRFYVAKQLLGKLSE